MAKKVQKVDTKERAKKVAEIFDLAAIRLLSFRATRDPNVLPNPKKVNVHVEVKLRQGMDEKKDDTTLVVAEPHFRFSVYSEDEESELPISIEAKYQLIYKSKFENELSEAEITSFGERTVLYNAWPYWREFLQSTLNRMGLPAISIPLFRSNLAEHLTEGTATQKTIRKKTKRKLK